MNRVDLRAPFDRLWEGRDPFAELSALTGREYRSVKNRRTVRIEVDGKGFFVKMHRGIGWREIFKNLLQFKLPAIGAAGEYRALEKLKAIGVPTMEIAGFGERGNDPARRESFLITRELTGTVSLEDLALSHRFSPVGRLRIIRALGTSCGTMHRAGINHRDCYLCHYLLHLDTAESPQVRLSVIDLHRAQIRRRVPFRYRVKDVAGLLFSAFDLPLRRSDVWRFLRAYRDGGSLRAMLRDEGRFLRAVHRTARRLYFREFHKYPANDPFFREKGSVR